MLLSRDCRNIYKDVDLKKAVGSTMSSASCDFSSLFKENYWHWRRGKMQGGDPLSHYAVGGRISETGVRKTPTFLSFTFFICRINGLESKVAAGLKESLLFSVFRWGNTWVVTEVDWELWCTLCSSLSNRKRKTDPAVFAFFLSPFLGFQGQRILWILHLLTWKAGA